MNEETSELKGCGLVMLGLLAVLIVIFAMSRVNVRKNQSTMETNSWTEIQRRESIRLFVEDCKQHGNTVMWLQNSNSQKHTSYQKPVCADKNGNLFPMPIKG